VLSADQIEDLYIEGTPYIKRYFELYETIQTIDDKEWETVSLAPLGVPANAVVEVVVTNNKDRNERWGGVRAAGSALDRSVRLHEAKGKGFDAVTMHVQADDSSQIEIYAEKHKEIIFVIAGYWTGSSYQESFQVFDELGEGAWVDENLAGQGIGANQVVEILLVNTKESKERQAGVRANGATHQRLFNLHEAEDGGIDGVSLMVTTDPAATIEVYAEDSGDIEFYVLGSWTVPPGTYTEIAAAPLQVVMPSAWETIDLGPLAAPADSVVQFVLANPIDDEKNFLGVRKTGSILDDRAIELHEARSGGADFVTLHARLDAASQAEAYAQYGAAGGWFYPAGWWVLGGP
jgi:hypothetical protein